MSNPGDAGYTPGEVVVDAVADRPVVASLYNTLTFAPAVIDPDRDLDTDPYTKAAPGGTVEIPVTITFKDYLDGSEAHSFTVGLSGILSGQGPAYDAAPGKAMF